MNTAAHASAGRAKPRTLPRSCKAPGQSMQEPKLQQHSPHPTSHKDLVKMSQWALLFVKRSVSDKPRITFCRNKWHLLLYSNKSSEETGLKYQRRTLMCCSGNLPWWGDLIFTTAMETSSVLEYCNQQYCCQSRGGNRSQACQRALCPAASQGKQTLELGIFSSLFMTKKSPRDWMSQPLPAWIFLLWFQDHITAAVDRGWGAPHIQGGAIFL